MAVFLIITNNKKGFNWDTRQHVVKIIVNWRIMFEFMVIKYGYLRHKH